MKLLRNLLDKVKPNFEEGGKFEKFNSVYDSLETFLFVPGHETTKGAHIRDGIDMKRTMFMVIIALTPCLLFGMWNTGHQHFLALGEMVGLGEGLWDKFFYGLLKILPVIIVSYGVGLGAEFVFCIIKKHSINEGFLVSGMLIPLILPVETPLWMIAVATLFAVVIGKEVFGGTGMNILNVALTARAFLFFAYPTMMSGDKVWTALDGETAVDGFSGATPMGDAALSIDLNSKLAQAVESGDTRVAEQLQSQLTATMDRVPEFYDLFMGWIPGSVGETSALMCLIGAAILLFTGIASWRVMLSTLVGGITMAAIFNWAGANPFMQIPIESQLAMGGFMFGMVFMATDPVTAAQTNTGKYIYGFFIGLFAIMIRVFNPAYPEGMMLAILFMNVMAPMIDHYVIAANIKRRAKRTVQLQAA